MIYLEKKPLVEVSLNVTVEEIVMKKSESTIAPYKASIFIIKPGAESPLDFHMVKECWMIVDGYGSLYCNENKFNIRQGDTIYFEPLDKHLVRNIGSVDLKIISTWWD